MYTDHQLDLAEEALLREGLIEKIATDDPTDPAISVTHKGNLLLVGIIKDTFYSVLNGKIDGRRFKPGKGVTEQEALMEFTKAYLEETCPQAILFGYALEMLEETEN